MDNSEIVKSARSKLGVLQSDFGFLFGLSKYAVSRIERGSNSGPSVMVNCCKSILEMSDEKREEFLRDLLGLPKFYKDSVFFVDRTFGYIFKPGDKIKILNLITLKTTKEEIESFNGVEYQLKGKTSKENLGHSGFVMNTKDNSIYICLNKSPLLYVRKV